MGEFEGEQDEQEKFEEEQSPELTDNPIEPLRTSEHERPPQIDENVERESGQIETVNPNDIKRSDIGVSLTPSQRSLIATESERAMIITNNAQNPERGIFASGDPKSQFYNEIWARDSSFAITSAISRHNPEMAIKNLETIFSHLREDGTLPLRIEYDRHYLHFIPLIRSIRRLIDRSKGHPVYEDAMFAQGARDTVSSIIIACGETFRTGDFGEEFVMKNWETLQKIITRENLHIDPKDGLVEGSNYQSWTDSIKMPGKIAFTNILHFRALREMFFMASQMGRTEDVEEFEGQALEYQDQAIRLKESILEHFWDQDKGYFKAGIDDDRLDVSANIFACMYLANDDQGDRIQENLDECRTMPFGLLRNFDRPYPNSAIDVRHRIGNISGYHNLYIWPYLTSENILAKLKIANTTQDEYLSERFRQESVEEFIGLSQLHKRNGDFYEVLDPVTFEPVEARRLGITTYKSCPQFLASAASYLRVEQELNKGHLL